MRILHVIPSLAPRYGGPSQVLVDMCNQLVRKGIDCDVITTNADGDSELDVELNNWVEFHGLNCRFFHRQFSESLKYSRPAAKWLHTNIERYDIVHIHAVFSHLCIAAAKICLKQKQPYIIRPLGTLDPWSLSQKPVRKKLFLLFGLGKLIRNANALQYTTELEKILTEKNLGLNNGIVVPNGLFWRSYQFDFDEKKFKTDFPNITQGNYLLVLGRLDAKKNIESVLAGFQEVKADSRYKNLQLVISGDGNAGYKEKLTRFVKEHPNSNQIYFTGWVEGDSKLLLMAAAKLFLLPSFNENFGVSVAESLACGVPVVVSDQVYLSPYIEKSNSGWVCSNSESFGKSILNAMQSGEIDVKGENARELIRDKFDWAIVSTVMIEHYQDIIDHA